MVNVIIVAFKYVQLLESLLNWQLMTLMIAMNSIRI